MARGVSVSDVAGPFKRIMATLRKEAKRADVRIGWFRTAKHPSGIATAEIATIHEYGAPKASIPARSMLRATVDANRAKYARKLRDAWGSAIDGSKKIEGALRVYGEGVRGDVIERITEGIPPGIKRDMGPKRPEGSKALIDTGTMRDQIEVRIG